MLKQLWMSGILVAFLVFGIKIGAGISAQIHHPLVPKIKKWVFFTGCVLIYLFLFLGMYFLVTGLDLFEYIDRFVSILKYGMMLHFALAAGLFVWGVKLLLQSEESQHPFPIKAGLLLVMPCPVCVSVILLNLTLAFSLFPMAPAVTTAVLFGCFLGCIMVTMVIIALFKKYISSMNTFLGLSMVLVSLYFILTLLIAPVYPEIKAAFTMAVSNNPAGDMEAKPFMILAGTAFILGCIGFHHSYFSKVKPS